MHHPYVPPPSDPMHRDIMVIGASAGGISVLKKLVSSFPTDLPATVFITLHLFGREDTVLANILNSAGPLPAKHPSARQPITPGQIYLAPPDYHLVISPGYVELEHGPKENLQRPCINVMFRSAAAAYGPRVMGVLLTGMLDDGASGLWEIQQRGGITVVQDPKEAQYASMPESAIRGFAVDYVVRTADMGALLTRLAHEEITMRPHIDTASSARDVGCRQTCPECGGAMTRERLGNLHEYRCHVGHRFGLKTMIAEKTQIVERAISGAVAQLEELTCLLEEATGQSHSTAGDAIDHEIDTYRQQARELKEWLERGFPRTSSDK